MRYFLIVLVPMLFLVSCSGETVEPYDAGDVSSHYIPLSTGSTWSYSGYRSGLAIEGDTIIDGTAWVVRRFEGEDPTYMRREGDTYYQRTSDGEEIIILRERGELTTWMNYFDDPALDSRERVDYQVISIDERRIVNGNIYEDLMHVQVEFYSEEEGGDWDRTSLVARYYARGVGLVEEITLESTDVLEARLVSSDVVGSNVEVMAAAENEVDGGSASVTVDGVPWDVRRVSVDTARSQVYIASGYFLNGASLRIEMESLAPGVYQLGEGENGATYTWEAGRRITGGPSGAVEITTNNAAETSGTFSLEMENGIMIEGQFLAVH